MKGNCINDIIDENGHIHGKDNKLTPAAEYDEKAGETKDFMMQTFELRSNSNQPANNAPGAVGTKKKSMQHNMMLKLLFLFLTNHLLSIV